MGHSTLLLWRRVLAGDDRAAADVYRRYVQRLLALVRSKLSPRFQSRLDPEDVAQSVWRTFFIHARAGEFALGPDGGLWPLLAAIAIRKVHGVVERHSAAKRDPRREANIARAEAANDEAPAWLDGEPTPAEAAALVEETALALRSAGPAAREALEHHLAGMAIDEIAVRVGRTPRTVRRALERIRAALEERFAGVATSDEPGRTLRERAPDALLDYHDYTLHEYLSAGGTGKMYRATRRSDGACVAVKTLRKNLFADGRAIESFLREAALAARLSHPDIVRVYGVGQFPGGGHFLALDYVAGESLQALIERGPLEIAAAVNMVVRIGAALSFAHSRGVVHCDLKPANVLLAHDSQGELTPKLVDFGLARQRRTKNDGAALAGGTLAYMAPEQLDRGGAVDERTDVFGLGGVLYACLTGRAPFAGQSLRQRRANRAPRGPSPRRLRPDVPPDLDRIVVRALAPIPNERFATVIDFEQAIAAWQSSA